MRTRTSQSGRSVAAGFTLVELLLVVIILGILVGSIAADLRYRSQSFSLRYATRDLAAAIRSAIDESRCRQLPHQLIFTPDLRQYRVEEVSPNLAATQSTSVHGMAGQFRQLSRDIQIQQVVDEQGNVLPECSKLGFGQEDSFAGCITLQSSSGQSMTIRVVGDSGQVTIRE